MNEELLYMIALTQVDNIGVINGKKLIKYCGSAAAIFKEKKNALASIHGIGDHVIKSLQSKVPLKIAEKELDYATQNSIRIISFLDNNYPYRLKQCYDCPIVLYVKGNALPKNEKMLAVVGTRMATNYGKKTCEEFVSGLKDLNVGIVSGLAYGIDAYAHSFALKNNLSTYAVLGSGFKNIYPSDNRQLAINITTTGSLISEFISETKPDRENFPQRNRIIAGLSDAVLVIEAADKGGALITAEIANSYDREVFAVPGRIVDHYSSGCNNLISKQKAIITSSVKDIIENMNWSDEKKSFIPRDNVNLSDIQKNIMTVIEKEVSCDTDSLSISLNIPINKLSFELLDMELSGVVKCLPGNKYELT